MTLRFRFIARIIAALIPLLIGAAVQAADEVTVTSEGLLVPSTLGEEESQFGTAVAVNGDTAVVRDRERAYVFVRAGESWTQQAELQPSARIAETTISVGSVGISGNTIVLASQQMTGAFRTPTAEVFVRSGSSWTRQAILVPPGFSPVCCSPLNHAVAISGDTVVLGAVEDQVTPGGSAYVFVRSGSAWSFQAKLVSSDLAPNDRFGSSVSIDGHTIVVGAYSDDVGANTDAGSAYVFVRSGSSWSQQAQLVASDAAASSYFGRSTAVSGDVALVGAFLHDTAAGSDAGAAYVFRRTGTTWTEETRLTAAIGSPSDYFGASVALSGETAVVGAPDDDTAAGAEAGSAHIFVRESGAWIPRGVLEPSAASGGASFGSATAVHAGRVLVGANLADTVAGRDAGRAHVFEPDGSSWTERAALLPVVTSAARGFGSSIDIDGDVAVAGAPEDGYGAQSFSARGGVFVFTRSGASWSQQTHLLPAATAWQEFGESVAISGDTLLIGAPMTARDSGRGVAYVYRRTAGVWQLEATLAPHASAMLHFGRFVDLDGDTAVVSNGEGVCVFVRQGTAWSHQADLTSTDGGFSTNPVAVSGSTIVVGAIQNNAAYVFVRVGGSWTQQAKLPISATRGGSCSGGVEVAVDGDIAVLGDRCYTAASNPTFDSPTPGRAYVFVRTGTNWTEHARITGTDSIRFGSSLAVDGRRVLVAAANEEPPHGVAYLYLNSGSSWVQRGRVAGGLDVSIEGARFVTAGVIGTVYRIDTPGQRWVRGDYTGEFIADPAVFRPSTGQWLFADSTAVQWGAPGDTPVPGDYDGDTIGDLAVYRGSTGAWRIRRSSDGATSTFTLGGSSDSPAPADYDGDGLTDAAVFNKATGVWTIRRTSDGSTFTRQWGGSGGDIPVPADYDGDGTDDVAIFSQGGGSGGGTWYIVLSSNGTTRVVQWGGTGGDIPIPADFDGDRRADIAIESPLDGFWYIILSSNGGTRVTRWGGSGGDQPQPADFDGDGRADIAIFNAGEWLIVQSSNGTTSEISLGMVGDVAVSWR